MSPDKKATPQIRHRAPQSTRRHQSPRPSSSPSPSPRRSKPTPKPIEIFHKSYSEPSIFPLAGDGDDLAGGCRSLDSDEGGWFCWTHTSDDLFACTDHTSQITTASPLSRINAKDAKVVIAVTVEGSPGPIKTLVKLGTSVEETIKLIIQKYGEEGRTPRLDKDVASFFDLHVTCFSLESLERSNAIGEVGSRSFYLRKSGKKSYAGNGMEVATASLFSTSENVYVQGNSPPKQANVHVIVLPPVLARKISKFLRRLHKLFKLFSCLHCR